MRTLRVDIYSDYCCPWCYLGAARFDRLREQLPGDVALEARWRPFEIHPEVPPGGMPVERLPYPPGVLAQMKASLRRQAEAEGLELQFGDVVPNTRRALLASEYVQREAPDRFERFHRRLFEAAFVEARNLSDDGVLREAARRVGIDPEAMFAAIDAGHGQDALDAARRTAQVAGITGTPTWIFDDRYALVGAQPLETMRRVVDRVLARRAA